MPETGDEIAGLVERARQYDREAFAELYRLAVQPVYRYLAARVSSDDLAEELTQEVFLAALAGIGGLRAGDEAGLYAWLYRIARHKLADHLRRRYRQPGVPLDGAAELKAPSLQPDEVAEAREEERELRAALADLTPEQREVVVYKYVLGYDNQRTGQLPGRTANAVNQLHHRALGSLHRLLEKRGTPAGTPGAAS